MLNRALTLGLRVFSRLYPPQKPLVFSGVGAASRNRFDDTDRDALMAIRLLVEFLPVAFDDGTDVRASPAMRSQSRASATSTPSPTRSAPTMTHRMGWPTP